MSLFLVLWMAVSSLPGYVSAELENEAEWQNARIPAGQADLSGCADTYETGGYALKAVEWANAGGLITGTTDGVPLPESFCFHTALRNGDDRGLINPIAKL